MPLAIPKRTAGHEKPLMEGGPLFDAHCHVLNLEYLVLEGVQILYDMIRGAYPLREEGFFEESTIVLPELDLHNPLDQAEDFLTWALQIGLAAFRSETSNVQELRRAADTVWGVSGHGMIPLMMDVYFMFSPPLAPAGWKPTLPAPVATHPPTRLDRHVQALRTRMARVVRTVGERLPRGAGAGRGSRIERLLGHLVERVLSAEEASAGAPGFRMTAGFLRQFQDAAALGARGSGIYPFFAVDARREGVVDWVINGGMVGPDGPFYGIKLYPRLGCHPGRPELAPLFAFCAARGIPLTTHTSHKGFPEWLTAYADFGNPEGFRPLFESHPDLRIDFAHFGDRSFSEDTREDWGMKIASLMREFDGVYTDLSCFTHDPSLKRFIERFQDMPKMRERTLFGSDFNVLFFTEPGMTLQRYYQRFLDAFGGERLAVMAGETPRAFLGI